MWRSSIYRKKNQTRSETAAQVEKEGRKALLIEGDVKNSKFCKKAVEKTVKKFGKLDILVNNAAFQKHQKSIEDISDKQLEETFKTNIFGYFYMARAALKHLKEGSAIINTGSITGFEGSKELLDYSATKGAIHAFTKSLAQNLVEKRIRVNCVSPGPIWTPLNVADKEPEEVAKHGADTPMKRPGTARRSCAGICVFCFECRFELYHGRGFNASRRRNDGGMKKSKMKAEIVCLI